MKILFSIICLIYWIKSYSTEIKIGAIFHYHYTMGSREFKNKLTDNGRIIWAPIFIDYENRIENYPKASYSFFASTDSIASPLIGIKWEYEFYQYESHRLTSLLAAYLINAKKWEDIKSIPQYYVQVINHKIAMVIPVIGIKYEYNIHNFQDGYFSVISTLTFPLASIGLFYTIKLN